MRFYLWLLSALLAGCANGTLVSPGGSVPADASLLVGARSELQGIRPLWAPDGWEYPMDSDPTQARFWLLAGWYRVQYACDAVYYPPSDDPDALIGKFRINDGPNSERNIKIEPGSEYRFECSPVALNISSIKKVGPAPNQPLHPDAQTRAGERQR